MPMLDMFRVLIFNSFNSSRALSFKRTLGRTLWRTLTEKGGLWLKRRTLRTFAEKGGLRRPFAEKKRVKEIFSKRGESLPNKEDF